MRIGFDSASATSAACASPVIAVDGGAQPRLLALRTARVDEPGIGRSGEDERRDRHRQRRIIDAGQATGRSSFTRWLTTRLDPPGGIDTP